MCSISKYAKIKRFLSIASGITVFNYQLVCMVIVLKFDKIKDLYFELKPQISPY